MISVTFLESEDSKTLDSVDQWTTGYMLKVTGLTLNDHFSIGFTHSAMSCEDLAVDRLGKSYNNISVIPVPNYLFTVVGTITVTVSDKTIIIPIQAASKPSDYSDNCKCDTDVDRAMISEALSSGGSPGEKGEQGERGTGILKISTQPTNYTIGVRCSLSTVLSQSGVDKVLVGDILEYSIYHYLVYDVDESYVYAKAVTQYGVSISSTRVTYQASSSGTTAPTGAWSTTVPTVAQGQYLWTKTYIAYVAGSTTKTTTTYSVAYQGKDGSGGSGSGLTFDDIYPVGSIYMSMNGTSPAELFGGEWEQILDAFLLAAGGGLAGYSGETGGENVHTLTQDELPEVKGQLEFRTSGGNNIPSLYGSSSTTPFTYNGAIGSQWATMASSTTNSSKAKNTVITFDNGGQGVAHNNMPPYLSVFMWQRVS